MVVRRKKWVDTASPTTCCAWDTNQSPAPPGYLHTSVVGYDEVDAEARVVGENVLRIFVGAPRLHQVARRGYTPRGWTLFLSRVRMFRMGL